MIWNFLHSIYLSVRLARKGIYLSLLFFLLLSFLSIVKVYSYCSRVDVFKFLVKKFLL